MFAHALICGAAQFAPTSISGCILWLRADLGVTLTSGKVSTWADQSGSGNDFTQGTSGNRPVVATGINGLSTIQFTRANPDFLSKASWGTPTSAEVFVVTKNTDASDSGLWIPGSAVAGSDSWYPFSAQIYEGFGQTNRTGALTPTTALTNAHVHHVRAQSGTNNYVVDQDTNNIGTATVTVGWPSTFTIGKNLGGNGYAGHIGEVVMYNTILSAGNRTLVLNYLKARWGTP